MATAYDYPSAVHVSGGPAAGHGVARRRGTHNMHARARRQRSPPGPGHALPSLNPRMPPACPPCPAPATQVDQASIDILLVGDSAGMVVHGHDTTLPITLEQMLSHCQSVARGAQRAFLVRSAAHWPARFGISSAAAARPCLSALAGACRGAAAMPKRSAGARGLQAPHVGPHARSPPRPSLLPGCCTPNRWATCHSAPTSSPPPMRCGQRYGC
jgi:hypothetical protein